MTSRPELRAVPPVTELPAPPVAADLEVRSLEIFPLNAQLLLRSKTWLRCKRRPELAFYVLNLWVAAFYGKPACSLENDDELLCDAAQCEPSRWPEFRAEALHGFTLHADGRLYHPVLVEMAGSALEQREVWRAQKAKWRASRRGKKAETEIEEDQDVGDDVQQDVQRTSADVRRSPLFEGCGLRVEGSDSKNPSPNGEGSPPAAASIETPMGKLAVPVDEAQLATALYNEMAKRANAHAGDTVFPLAIRPTGNRRNLIAQRLKECGGVDAFKTVLDKVEASDFLTGRSGRSEGHANWRCDLGWIVKAENFTKIVEGRYSGRAIAPARRQSMGDVAAKWLEGDGDGE